MSTTLGYLRLGHGFQGPNCADKSRTYAHGGLKYAFETRWKGCITENVQHLIKSPYDSISKTQFLVVIGEAVDE
jgi:hypothetical protein